MSELSFENVARLPFADDNVAVATCNLRPGETVRHGDARWTLAVGVLEGHRFAVAPIAPGEELRSWGLPFGRARSAIAPGDYLINERMLKALRTRRLPFALPAAANFDDVYEPFQYDPAAIVPTAALPITVSDRRFDGFPRSEGRGTGTRNHVVLLGLSAAAGAYAQAIAPDYADAAGMSCRLDGVCAVAHTEGGGRRPNNLAYVMRTLAGFAIHPNVGGVVLLDDGDPHLNADTLRAYMAEHGYPLHAVPHRIVKLDGDFAAMRAAVAAAVPALLKQAAAVRRQPRPVSELAVALQCGGSDAFSGISGNPLAGWIAHAVIAEGGRANLAETDELIGAESYILQQVKDHATAERFLGLIDRYRELAGRHGHSPEGNPSGGNYYRGLYNIVIKSIGAAMKKHPAQRLDAVLDYGERMLAGPGYYFMDSPGNDLESVAGQVATGCNLIYFVTGNGSITNFPFVPTVKIVTTTGRYKLLPNEMDVNAGRYLDGESMDSLGADTLKLSLNVASGERTAGERAAHSQVQIWRDWARAPGVSSPATADDVAPDGLPLVPAATGEAAAGFAVSPPRTGLLLPTSLCAGQIAGMIANGMNRDSVGLQAGLMRFTTLAHTEGCGVSSGASEALYVRTLLGYAVHPLVGAALFLEHGCEKTHNDYMRDALAAAGADPTRYGWASIQLDGGLATVTERVRAWAGALPPATGAAAAGILGSVDGMAEAAPAIPSLSLMIRPTVTPVGTIGLMHVGPLDAETAELTAGLVAQVLAAGWSVILPESDALLATPALRRRLPWDGERRATLAYGQVPAAPGLHLMAAPNPQPAELLAGIGAAGARVIVAHVVGRAVPAHPLVPVLQISRDPDTAAALAADLDLAGVKCTADGLTQLVKLALRGARIPRLFTAGVTQFQISRGLTGFSL